MLTASGASESIVRVEETIEKGVYAPLTEEGTVVVDGIMASCYSNYNSHQFAHAVHPYAVTILNALSAAFGYKDANELASHTGILALGAFFPLVSV